jgi:hypothetical protein
MYSEYLFTLGAADFDALFGNLGIVKSKSGLAFFAFDDHQRLLDGY